MESLPSELTVWWAEDQNMGGKDVIPEVRPESPGNTELNSISQIHS